MSKAIMISIKPQWVAKILNGEKTIEIRKTCPEIFKHLKPYEGCSTDVYIYCTKVPLSKQYWLLDKDNKGNLQDPYGKIVAKFTLNKVEEIDKDNLDGEYWKEIEYWKDEACLTYEELYSYLKGKKGYAWHIEDLEIFDYPKEICEFKRITEYVGLSPILKELTKAPQSWCYIEV